MRGGRRIWQRPHLKSPVIPAFTQFAFTHPAFIPTMSQDQCHSSAGHLVWKLSCFLEGYWVPCVWWML